MLIMPLAFIGGIGWAEVIIVLAVILLLFGGKKIPELMRGLGKGIREFNTARASIKSEIEEGMKDADKAKAAEKKEKEAEKTED